MNGEREEGRMGGSEWNGRRVNPNVLKKRIM